MSADKINNLIRNISFYDGFAFILIKAWATKIGGKFYPNMQRNGEAPTFINVGSLSYKNRWKSDDVVPSFESEELAVDYSEKRIRDFFRHVSV